MEVDFPNCSIGNPLLADWFSVCTGHFQLQLQSKQPDLFLLLLCRGAVPHTEGRWPQSSGCWPCALRKPQEPANSDKVRGAAGVRTFCCLSRGTVSCTGAKDALSPQPFSPQTLLIHELALYFSPPTAPASPAVPELSCFRVPHYNCSSNKPAVQKMAFTYMVGLEIPCAHALRTLLLKCETCTIITRVFKQHHAKQHRVLLRYCLWHTAGPCPTPAP